MNNSIRKLIPIGSILRNETSRIVRGFMGKCDDIVIHTGQKWDADDYRMVRYINSQKLVNMSWAVQLIADLPAKKVNERVVWCDGGSGPEGHPRIYINLDKPGEHACGYCGLRFTKLDAH